MKREPRGKRCWEGNEKETVGEGMLGNVLWEKGCSEGGEKGTVGEGCGGVVVRRRHWGETIRRWE